MYELAGFDLEPFLADLGVFFKTLKVDLKSIVADIDPLCEESIQLGLARGVAAGEGAFKRYLANSKALTPGPIGDQTVKRMQELVAVTLLEMIDKKRLESGKEFKET